MKHAIICERQILNFGMIPSQHFVMEGIHRRDSAAAAAPGLSSASAFGLDSQQILA